MAQTDPFEAPENALRETPQPTTITAALLKQHSITDDEYARIETAMGRVPSLTELGIYSVMWSEHCSYKSSRVHLKRLPTQSARVVQGPGENAGIIDVGDGWACAFKIESHNHPSYIEPFQGAATGVGGILRDIFTMNARPFAVMDSLRFGPLSEQPIGALEDGHTAGAHDRVSDAATIRKNHSVMEGVVAGVSHYGNCFGVPNLGGETRFEPCYSGNPLLNAFALGLVRLDEIFYAKATGVGNPVIYVGAKTGRDGIHGATMASEEFKEGSEQKRPNVQVGDPFMEKLLLEGCIEAMATGAVLGIQDMGAAGLTCSTCEMGARGGVGVEIELDRIPQRETGMNSYEIMLSESQERMLLVAEKGREGEVLQVFAKWGLDAVVAGEVIAENRMRVRHHGVLVADLSNQSLTDDAPVYHRPVGEWIAPVSRTAPASAMEREDCAGALRLLLGASNICSKRWVYDQYDSMVQTNTVHGPGAEQGLMRIKGTERGLAMALDGNGRWCYLDPKLGAQHAVAEAARKVACTGATPVAATNCLNFGNPEKPEIMAQLSAAIDGIAEACTVLGTPITGGNVSLYNETRGEGIYPTPVLGIVGILEKIGNAVGSGFTEPGQSVLLIAPASTATIEERMESFGSSEYAKTVLGELWGTPPALDLAVEAALHKVLATLAEQRLVASARDISDGGIAVALAEGCFERGIGVQVDLPEGADLPVAWRLFHEGASQVLVSCAPEAVKAVRAVVTAAGGLVLDAIGTTVTGQFTLAVNGTTVVDEPVTGLRHRWDVALESMLHEVTA
ncbi:phosphoribosylformylglycinamidine synthase subunit PurL [Acidipila sp. EB88]|uniref:phosphoribosylformylglycinamidine synthase subunit PurL n=1 Tax=Acidipila sp. EB88 TaxID=2305226 RepID=UPI000F5F68DC|nr:phosphoribosylformylglycinamidine synthase subunit PurL [Acidipila sp. EB88]RRA50005.1 phosphoribosylformylglycinamidine synthase subunit PurL [Acidipila sp. EB88]